MNPFSLHNKTKSTISILSTNIRGLASGTKDETLKLNAVFDIGADINIIIDSHLDPNKMRSLMKGNSHLLSRYTHKGSLTRLRGIDVFTKKSCGVKVKNLEILQGGNHLHCTLAMPDGTNISASFIYAPSNDDQVFWKDVFQKINSSENSKRLIIGDCNVTLNHQEDTKGYITDPHKLSRAVINKEINNETFIDLFTHTHPGEKSYTFRTKNCKKRSRLDLSLISPSLLTAVTSMDHLAHPYTVTDHSSLLLKLDFTHTIQGKGTFRCPAGLHNDPTYHRLAANSIKSTILRSMEVSERNQLLASMMETRIHMEEELHAIQNLIPSWNTSNRENALKHTIAILLSTEPSNEDLMRENFSIPKADLLELVLANLKVDTQIFTRNAKVKTDTTFASLQAELQSILSEEDSPESKVAIEDITTQLEAINNQKLQATLEKKAAFNLLENEKPTKAFLNMENAKGGYSEITKLNIPNPNFDKDVAESLMNIKYFPITNGDAIREEARHSFQKIFDLQDKLKTNTNDIINYLNSDGDAGPMEALTYRRITREDAMSMEGPLTIEELTTALFKHMKGSSSPGIDGFTVNHLRSLWHDLGHLTKDALNSSFGNKMTHTLRSAVIKLLRKGTKDPTLIGNYRPISLLSIFYKLASCAITQRIKPAVNKLIGRQQKAYITQNNIGSVILNLINMMKHVKKEKKNALILLIDFKKAFDSISHTFIKNTLSIYGFGDNIISWVSLFFEDREATILLGGHMSEKIFLRQGVPQGDIISPYIFILMVEILLLKINYTKHLTGVKFARLECRSETFADDTTIILQRTKKNLITAKKYLTDFHTISGLSCNVEKTNVIPIGSNTNHKDTICNNLGFEWTNSFTLLGFKLENTLTKTESNFDIVKEKIDNIINTWRPYHLSLRGRVTVAKTKMVSQLTYVATVLDIPEKLIKTLQTQIDDYVLGVKPGGRKWMNPHTLYAHTSEGGLGMISLKHFIPALKTSWIRRYVIDKIDDHWADMVDSFLKISRENRDEILEYGPEKFNGIIKACLPGISSIFAGYKSVKALFPTDPEAMDNAWLHQNIFYNTNFNRKNPGQKSLTHLTPGFYGIAELHHKLKVIDFFPRGTFISQEDLETKIGANIVELNYRNLKSHIKAKIGLHKKYQAIPKNCTQKKGTHPTIKSLMESIKKGSGKYRRILARAEKRPDINNPTAWKKKLNDDTITPSMVKRMKTNLLIKEIQSDANDCLTRIKYGRTMYGSQGVHAGVLDDPWCSLCRELSNIEVEDSFVHYNYSCPHVLPIITEVTQYFLGHTPTCTNYIMGMTCSPLGQSIQKELGLKISSLILNQTVHFITTRRRAKQALEGTGIIIQIISHLSKLSLIPTTKKLQGIFNSAPFQHFLTLTPNLFYSAPT